MIMKHNKGIQHDDENEIETHPSTSIHEVSEVDLLRGRIDEQSSLIMILKQRADEAIEKASQYERAKLDYVGQMTSLEARINDESKKSAMLEERFYELAGNHEEMIKIKDEYKAQNEKLRTENIQLRRDNEQLFSKQLNMLTAECEAMQNMNEKITREAKTLDAQNRNLDALLKEANELREKERNESKKHYGDRISNLEEELRNVKERSKVVIREAEDLKTKLAASERNHANEKEKLAKEKDELLALVMERGRIIQDKQSENKGLQIQVSEIQRQLQTTKQRFQEEADRVDADSRVTKFRDQLYRLQSRYDSLSKAHEAFKKHTSNMLDNERLLNNQLASYTTPYSSTNQSTNSPIKSLPDIKIYNSSLISPSLDRK